MQSLKTLLFHFRRVYSYKLPFNWPTRLGEEGAENNVCDVIHKGMEE